MAEQEEKQNTQSESSSAEEESVEASTSEDEPTAEEASSGEEPAPDEETPEGEAESGEETSDGDEQADGEEADGEEADGEPLTAAEKSIAAIAAQAATPEDVLEAGLEERNMRKERVGLVVSDKMDKTIVVSIERRRKHPIYKKYLNRSARKMAHDEGDEAGEGDTVRIMETRPISKHKRWRLVEILERAE